MDLNDQPLFTCHMCDRGSHNCAKMKEFLASLPKTIPNGFVWICPACMGDSDSQETCIVQSENLIQHEKQDKQDNKSTDNEPTATLPGGVAIAQYQLPIKNTAKNSNRTTATICHKYKRGVCPHGLRGTRVIEGETCKFDHPRACRNYKSYGSGGPYGCRRYSKCKYYHPVLCRYSVQERLCINEKCTFVHLKGTLRHSDDRVHPSIRTQASYPNTSQRHNDDRVPPSIRTQAPRNKQAPMLTGGNNINVSPKNDSLDRIEVMIRDLKLSQETEISHLKRELEHIKSVHMQPRWGMVPPWHQSQLAGHPSQTYSQIVQSHPVQPQGRMGQAQNIAAPPSCY